MHGKIFCAVLVIGFLLSPAVSAITLVQLELVQARAENEDPEAQFLIGIWCLEGFDGEDFTLETDPEEARIWLGKAAGQGNSNAQYMLGEMYLNGLGVEKDIDQAISWYNKAERQNNELAVKALANLYLNPDSVVVDYHKSMVLLNKSTELFRDGAAAHSLGFMYSLGLGVNIDLIEAYKWHVIAMHYGSESAKDELTFLEERIRLIEIGEAKKRAETWLNSHE